MRTLLKEILEIIRPRRQGTTAGGDRGGSENVFDISGLDKRTIIDLISAYESTTRDLRGYYKQIEEIKDTYIAEIILEQISYDVITPDVSGDPIVSIAPTTDDKRISDALEELTQRVDIDQLIMDIIDDLIAYGEYTIKPVVEEGEGVVDIIDTTPGEVVSFYENQELAFHLRTNPDTGQYTIHEPHEYVKFYISSKRIKLKLPGKLTKYVREKERASIPEYIRLGSPLFTPGKIKKIKQLNLLEELIPAIQVQSISRGSLLGVYVPPSMEPKEALDYARRLENKINNVGVGINRDMDRISVAEIIKSATYKKVIPITSEKGQVTEIHDSRKDAFDILSPINDLREVILTSVGIPPELVFNTERGEGRRSEILKKYSRYFRKLKYIQKSIINGLKELVRIHLANRGIYNVKNSFTIRFNNFLINIDDLDKLEFQQATAQILSDIKRFIDELEDNYSDYIDKEKFIEYINSELTKVGLDPIIRLPGEERI